MMGTGLPFASRMSLPASSFHLLPPCTVVAFQVGSAVNDLVARPSPSAQISKPACTDVIHQVGSRHFSPMQSRVAASLMNHLLSNWKLSVPPPMLPGVAPSGTFT